MRFGHRVRWVVSLAVIAAAAMGCSARGGGRGKAPADAASLPEITRDMLATQDGAEGRPAYIAVRGLVYDVTDAPGWADGVHAVWSSERLAGRDLTVFLAKAPPSHRQDEFWAALPVVGKLRD